MGVVEMQFTFEREQQAQDGLAAARTFIAGSDAAVEALRLDGKEVTFDHCDVVQLTDLDDDQSFFMQLCFYWAECHSEAPFTGVGRLRMADGNLCAEKVFYDGYVLGFKCLEDVEPDFAERAWRDVGWHLWIPLHGHFLDLVAWRTSSDF